MKNYPEIEALKQYFVNHQINIEVLTKGESHYGYWVKLSINASSWVIYVDDEYGDLSNENQSMALYLTLTALEDYQESTDFLRWCNEYQLNASNSKLLEHYKSLEFIVKEVSIELGGINPQASPYAYAMNMDVAKALRNQS